MKKIIVVGMGFLGRYLLRKIHENKIPIKVVGIADLAGYLYDPQGLELSKAIKAADSRKLDSLGLEKGTALDLIEKAEADVMVELTPTNVKTGEPGFSHIMKALETGKNVATSNKGPFVTHFRKIIDKAEEKGLKVFYGATVGGAMPTISMPQNCMKGYGIEAIYGIVNGTTNYILSTMFHEERGFENVLKEAQEMGYAEADPSYDIDGIDAANKMVILANTFFGKNATVKDVKRTGISKISVEAVKLAKRNNRVIKLIAYVDKDRMEVAPMLLPVNHPLNVEGSLNAVVFRTDLANNLVLMGRGAGRETVATIINDILSV